MQFNFHFPHVHFFHRAHAEALGLKPLYWNMFLLRLAQSFSYVFVPVYLVQIGFDIFGQQSLAGALGFMFVLYFFMRLVAILVAFPAAWAARAFGFRWTILFSNILRAGVFVLLILARTNVWLLLTAMMFMGMVVVFYWPSFHTVFTADVSDGHTGRSVGMRIIAEKAAGVVGPVLGGIVVAVLGFEYLFGIGVVLVLLSAVPLFLMQHHSHADKVSLAELFKWLSEARFVKAAVSFSGLYAYEMTRSVLWPVYIYLVLASYEQLGEIFSVAALFAVVATWVVGSLFDKGNKKRLFKVGSIATAGIWMVKATLTTFGQILAVDSISKVTSVFFMLPYKSYTYERARGEQAFSFMVYRELLISVGSLVFWLVALGLAFFPWRWYGLFALGAVGVLVSQFILEDRK